MADNSQIVSTSTSPLPAFPKRLIFIRHGDADLDMNRLFPHEPELTEQGHQEAEQARKTLQLFGFNFERIFCSKFERTQSTLEAILGEQLQHKKDKKQNNLGASFQGIPITFLTCLETKYRILRNLFPSFQFGYKILHERAKEAREAILAIPEKYILVVSHSAIIQAFIVNCLETPGLILRAFPMCNTGLTVIDFLSPTEVKLIHTNLAAHLSSKCSNPQTSLPPLPPRLIEYSSIACQVVLVRHAGGNVQRANALIPILKTAQFPICWTSSATQCIELAQQSGYQPSVKEELSTSSSTSTLWNQASTLFQNLVAQSKQASPLILIITHQSILKALICFVLQLKEVGMSRLTFEHASISMIHRVNGEEIHWKTSCLNSISHFQSIYTPPSIS